MQSNFFLGFSTFSIFWGQKLGFWGPGPSPMHPDQNLEPDPGLHTPNWIFWSHFRPNSLFFDHFCKVDFLGPSAFSEFTNFFKCGVYTRSHAHQRMRLEKFVWKNAVSARDLEYEIKVFQKTIFKSVRRPFSSWSDRRSFQIFLWVIRAFAGLNFRIVRVFGVHTFLHP